jgi:DNA-binding NtrC family response regulator
MMERQRILVVDDEVHMLRLLERILTERTQHDIVCTGNSLEVPELLEQRTFDLVIADLKMPGLDGIDILRWLRTHDRNEELIMITAFGSLESTMTALELGASDYITKPFKRDQILVSVERAMRWQRLRRSAARLDELLTREPYAAAEAEFRTLYLRTLADRSGGDVAVSAERAKLPLDQVRRELEGRASAIEKEERRDDSTGS